MKESKLYECVYCLDLNKFLFIDLSIKSKDLYGGFDGLRNGFVVFSFILVLDRRIFVCYLFIENIFYWKFKWMYLSVYVLNWIDNMNF